MADKIEWGAGTDGPWFVVRYGDGDSLVICQDEAGDQRVTFMATPGCRDLSQRKQVWKRIKANARAIAEVPAMVAAMREIIAYRDRPPHEAHTGGAMGEIEMWGRARAILARIDGK